MRCSPHSCVQAWSVALVVCALAAQVRAEPAEPTPAPDGGSITPTPLMLRLREPGPEASVRDRQAYWSVAPLPPLRPPEGLERKPALSDFQRRQKRAQKPVGVVGLPELGGNPDYGFVVGAVAAATWYGEDDENPFYDYTPYEQRLIVEGHVSLKRAPNVLGRQSYRVRYTRPYVAGTLFSLSTEAAFLMNANAQYFGADAATMGSLAQIAPAALSGESFSTYRDYQSTLRRVEGGSTYAVYHQYLLQEPRASFTVKVDLLGGILVPAATLSVSRVFVERYGGDRVRGSGDTGISEPTKLDEDCESGVARHCRGAWDNTVRLALTLDTRDLPVDPDRGVLLDVTFEGAPEFLGSPGYYRVTQSAAGYISPLQLLFGLDDRWSQLVLAGRIVYSVAGGDLPFYALHRLAFHNRTIDALGGINTMRGYRLNRFAGPVMALATFELRYDLFFVETRRSTLNVKLVPFYDTGRVWNAVRDTRLRGFRHDGGLGLCLQWNQTNVIRGDLGFGDEGISGGLTFGLSF